MLDANSNMPGEIYCRKCGYDLRGQAAAHRCPECGREFDPADFTTFFAQPPDGARWRWTKRILLGVLVLLVTIVLCFWNIIRWLADHNYIEAP